MRYGGSPSTPLTMLVEVVAVPLSATPIRLGARFTVKEGVPLIIGPSPQARIRLSSAPTDKDLVVDQRVPECVVRTDGVPVASAVNGVAVEKGAQRKVEAGDHLFITGGLVIRFGERPLDPRDAGLERTVADALDRDANWRVYDDFLLERGAPPRPVAGSIRELGPLAFAQVSGAMTFEWGPHGFLRRAQLLRNAVVGTPGLFWHLEQLAHLRAARFLTQLDIDYFVGTAPAHVDRAFESSDATLSAALKVLGNSDFAASLRVLTLGHVAVPQPMGQASATFEHLRQRWPHLEGGFTSLVHDGARARLEVIEVPSDVAVVGLSVGESWQLPPHASIGSAADARLRLLGANIPPQLAGIHRSREGAWSIAAEGVDGMSSGVSSSLKLNGQTVALAALHGGDVIELLPGLKLRFRPE